MTLPDDLRASGSLFVRRGDGEGLGALRLLADGWRAAFNPPASEAEGAAAEGFPSAAAALAWMAAHPQAAGDLSTVPGAQLFGPGAVLPLTPWNGPAGHIALLLRPNRWGAWCRKTFGGEQMPSLVAWRQGAAAPEVAGALRPEGDGRWTVWRTGRRPQTYASRIGAQTALGAHLADGAATAHARMTLATLPEQAIDRLEALQAAPLRPEGPARLGLSGRLEIVRGDGALVGIATALSEGRGFRAEPTGRPSSLHDTPDAALAAAAADVERFPDLRAQGAVMLPLGLALPLAGAADGPLVAAPLRARGVWADLASYETGSSEQVEALLADGKEMRGLLRRQDDGRLRLLVPDRFGQWPRGKRGGRLVRDAADGLRRLAEHAQGRICPAAAAQAAPRLDQAREMRRICPRSRCG